MRKYLHSFQSSTWHQSRFVRRRRHRRPPFFLGEDRAGCASKSVIHPRRSRGQTPCHTPSRVAPVPRQSQHVKATRYSSVTGSSSNLSQQPRRHLLITFQALVFVFGKLLCQPLCFSSHFALGFQFVIRNGFLWTCFLFLWDLNHHNCKTQLEELLTVVCFRGAVVSQSRVP